MHTKMLAFATVGLVAAVTLTACNGSSDSSDSHRDTDATNGETGPRVGVIMPDTTSSTRWSTDDSTLLKKAFDAARIKSQIVNAQGDPQNFERIGQAMVDSGAKVLIIVSIDPDSGKAVIDAAHAKHVPVIDYDRLTVGGGADYYVSFDGNAVGADQAYGLIHCIKARNLNDPVVAELNGSPTDNNATLFKVGYDNVLQPQYDAGTYTKGPDQPVDNWDATLATAIFTQMITQQPKIEAVLAANDGIGNAAISVLKKHHLNGKVPVTGQDATVQGLQNILAGDQCMTVYKPFQPEAQTAANLAIQLYKGAKPTQKLDSIKDPQTGAYIPFASLTPKSIDISNIETVLTDGFVERKQICTPKYQELCTQHNIK